MEENEPLDEIDDQDAAKQTPVTRIFVAFFPDISILLHSREEVPLFLRLHSAVWSFLRRWIYACSFIYSRFNYRPESPVAECPGTWMHPETRNFRVAARLMGLVSVLHPHARDA